MSLIIMGDLLKVVLLITAILVNFSVNVLMKSTNFRNGFQPKNYKEILEFYNENGNNKFIDLLLTLFRLPSGFVGTWNMTIEEAENNTDDPIPRVKRDGKSHRFSDSTRMSQLKLLQLQLRMLKNMFSKEEVGGRGPFSPTAPKSVMKIFNKNIMDLLFPDVGFGNEKLSEKRV